MFSKTHYLLFFTMMTNMNPNKPNGDHKTRQKRAPKRTGTTQKTEENPKYHESTPKVPISLRDVLQNPQFTLFHYDDQQEQNENQMETPKHVKNTPKKNCIRRENKGN